MRAFCIGMSNHEKSLNLVNRCIASGKQFGVDVEFFEASNQVTGPEQFTKHGFTAVLPNGITDKPDWKEFKSMSKGETGCFMSHYRLWSLCVALDEPFLILEHDVIFMAPIPDVQFDETVDVSTHMRYGFTKVNDDYTNEEYIFPDLITPGVHELPYGRSLGSHGYMVNPTGAHKMIRYAVEHKPMIADYAIGSWAVKRQLLNPAFIRLASNGESTTSESIS